MMQTFVGCLLSAVTFEKEALFEISLDRIYSVFSMQFWVIAFYKCFLWLYTTCGYSVTTTVTTFDFCSLKIAQRIIIIIIRPISIVSWCPRIQKR